MTKLQIQQWDVAALFAPVESRCDGEPTAGANRTHHEIRHVCRGLSVGHRAPPGRSLGLRGLRRVRAAQPWAAAVGRCCGSSGADCEWPAQSEAGVRPLRDSAGWLAIARWDACQADQGVEEDYKLIKKEYAKLINIGSTTICPMVKFVGVQVNRDRAMGTITLSQTRYIEQLAEEYEGKFRLRSTPYGETKEERSSFDHLVPASPDETPLTKTSYLSLLGKIVWPSTMTRADCSEAVSVLCSMWPPSQRHYDLGLDVIGYLVKTKNMGITFGGSLRVPLGLKVPPPNFEQSCGLYVYHDSSFGSRPRPMGGYVIMYGNGPVDWHAGFLKIVPDSSHEAESAIGSRATKAVLFVRELLKYNNRKVYGPTPALGDNEALYKTVHHEGHSARVRHYERATLLFKRAVLLLLLKPYKISDVDMVADILTKAVESSSKCATL